MSPPADDPASGTTDGADTGTTGGTDSGSADGAESGTTGGADTGTTGGADSGTTGGADSGTTGGTDTGTAGGADSGTADGADTGTADGADSGTTDGADSGTTDGADSGTADGADSGTTGGTDTGTTDGADTGTDGSGSGGSVIGVESYRSVLRGLVDVIGNDTLESVHESYQAFIEPLRGDGRATAVVDGLTFVREYEVALDGTGGTVTRFEYTCDAGGTYAQTQLPAGRRSEFVDCEVDGVARDGTVKVVYARGLEVFEYGSFEQRGAGPGDVALDGQRSHGDYERSYSAKFTWEVSDFRLENADGVTVLSDASFENLFMLAEPPSSRPPPVEEYERSLAADFTVAAPWSGGESITVTTDTPFGDFSLDGGAYLSGVLVASAATDGSALVLDAGNGEPSSASVTVTEAGATSGFTVPWSEIGVLACLAPQGETPDTHGCRARR